MAAGTTHPSMKLPYNDPVSGYAAVRLTTDGNTVSGFRAANYLQDMSGEQGKSSPWSSDSIRICYSKGIVSGTTKQAGIYMMNTDTGIETQLVAVSNPFLSYPVWSRAGADEVYYTDVNGANVRIRAVLTVAPWTVRTIAQVVSSGQRQKIGINADGTLVSCFIQPNAGGQYRTIIAQANGGGILAGWSITGPASADGGYWHPTNPALGAFSRGSGPESTRLWNVNTLIQVHLTAFRASHAAVHPDGTRIYQIDSGTYRNFNTGAIVFDKGGIGAIHPHFSPADSALGDNAKILGDEAPFFFNPHTKPTIWIFTPAQAAAAASSGSTQSNPQRAGTQAFQHWSRSNSNSSHPHPTYSPNGLRVLWVSDKDSGSASQWSGAATCPVGALQGSEDLFMGLIPTAVATTTAMISAPNPSGSGQSVTLLATVEPIGGGVAGSVAFVSNLDGALGSAAVSSGLASLPISSLSVGSHLITATFTPTNPAAFTASVATPYAHTVQAPTPEATTTVVAITPELANFGSSVAISATVAAGGTVFPQGAALFNAATDRLRRTTDLPVREGPFTVSLVFKLNSITGGFQTLFYLGDAGVSSFTPFIAVNSSAKIYIETGNNSSNATGATTVTTGVWHSISYIRNGSSYEIRYDGATELTGTVVGTGSTTIMDLGAIGATSHPLDGFIANKRMWDTNLTGTEVDAHRDTYVISHPTNLVGKWDLISDALDTSGLGRDYTNTGVTFTSFGSPAPVGSVEFFDGGISLGTDALVAGVGEITTSSLIVGVHNIRAVFTPTNSAAFSASLSAEEQVTIEGIRVTSLILDVQPGSPQDVNTTLTLTATVTVVSTE